MIRRAVAADAGALAELAARTFTQAYGSDNRPEDLAAHLEESYGEAKQRQEIEDPAFHTLLAVEGEHLLGFAQLRRQEAPPGVTLSEGVELYRFYLDQATHGTGLAQRLLAEVKGAAKALGYRHVWLGVWERNPRAIAFYTKSGFVDRGSKVFVVGTDRQTDRVMVAVV
jgi:GNAT superfamily N-acetyltransferase